MTHTKKTLSDLWSSKWAFILAATGAAVGLGNVWRFPYMAGKNGGSAFVLIYLICVVVIGLPIMIAEILIGRRARQNPVDALATLAEASGRTRQWGWLGWWGALALLLVLSFYSVVAGWSVAYLIKSFSGQFHGATAMGVAKQWHQFLSSPWRLIAWHTVFMSLTIGVILRGVQQGLEKATKFMMPGLYLILVVLVIYAGINGDFAKACHFLFDFDTTKITGTVIIAAMGHAFFTLALGAGAMLTYGVYLPKRINIAQSVTIVAALDVLVAILSGLAIFPIVFKYHLSPSAGPGLMFVTLPIAFAHVKGGAIIGGLFFTLLLFAAWTSSINLAEPMVIILQQRLNISRTASALTVGFLAWFIGLGSALSFNALSHWTFMQHFTIFQIATNLPTDFILPIGGLGFAVFAGWVMSRKETADEVHGSVYPVWRFLVRYVAPVGILVVFISPFLH